MACGQGATVASVNGQAIDKAELERQLRVYLSVRQGQVDDANTRRQVLDQLIKQRLLVQAARAEGLDKDPGRETQLAEKRKALRAELNKSIADLQAQLAVLDDALETKALIDAYSEKHRGALTITAKDLQAAYELRAQREPLPPLASIREQMLEQVVLDRLVEQVRAKASISVDAKAAQ